MYINANSFIIQCILSVCAGKQPHDLGIASAIIQLQEQTSIKMHIGDLILVMDDWARINQHACLGCNLGAPPVKGPLISHFYYYYLFLIYFSVNKK